MMRRFSRADSGADLTSFLDGGHSANRENRWTFEVAWEAANKGELNDSISIKQNLIQFVLDFSRRNLHSHPVESLRVD